MQRDTILFRDDIQGIRALAVLSVIAYHLPSTIAGDGFIGVDIFFVISGYVISASSLTLLNSREWRSISIFYVKRIRRLLPALMFTVALGIAAIAFLIPPDNSKLEGFRTGLYSIVGMANIYLLYASTDYWREDSLLNPFLHMWSLWVEFQYYVIFPILVFLFFRFASSSPLIRSACLTIFVFAGVASLFSLLLGETYELKKFYSAQYRIWEFNIGIGAYLCVIRFKGSYLRAGALVTSMRLILNDVTYTILIIAFVFIGLEFMDRRSLTAFSCLITGAFLILNAHPASSTSSPLSNRLAVIIGDNSYSLYLVHFPVIFVFNYMMVFDTTWVYLSCILTIFALSYITWLFVEQSIPQRGSHKQVLRTTCATMLVAFVAPTIRTWFAACRFTQRSDWPQIRTASTISGGPVWRKPAIFSNMRRLLNPSEVIANMMVEPLPGDVPISVEIRGAGVAG